MTSSTGPSDWSPVARGTPVAQRPSAPDLPKLTPGNGELVVEWTEPASNGSFITGYDVEYRASNASPSTNWTEQKHTGTTTTTIPSLTNGQRYDVRVRATNSKGDSLWSPVATSAPRARVPDPPSALTVNAGDRHLVVSWNAPSNNGDFIIDYDVEYRASNASPSTNWTEQKHTGTGTTTKIDDLTNDQSYDVRVLATNSMGDSNWSPVATGTPGATVPDAPDAPDLTPGNGQLEVSWVAPAPNTAPITSYDVQYSEGNSGDWKNHPFSSDSTTSSTIIPSLDQRSALTRCRCGLAARPAAAAGRRAPRALRWPKRLTPPPSRS